MLYSLSKSTKTGHFRRLKQSHRIDLPVLHNRLEYELLTLFFLLFSVCNDRHARFPCDFNFVIQSFIRRLEKLVFLLVGILFDIQLDCKHLISIIHGLIFRCIFNDWFYIILKELCLFAFMNCVEFLLVQWVFPKHRFHLSVIIIEVFFEYLSIKIEVFTIWRADLHWRLSTDSWIMLLLKYFI